MRHRPDYGTEAQPIYFMPDGTPAPTVLNKEDLAKFLRIDQAATHPDATIHRMRSEHALPGARIGKHVMFVTHDVVQWLRHEKSGRAYESR